MRTEPYLKLAADVVLGAIATVRDQPTSQVAELERRWLRNPRGGGFWMHAAGIDHVAALEALTKQGLFDDVPVAESAYPLLSTREAAARLGISFDCLKQMRYRRAGPAFVKLSKCRVSYRVEDIEAWRQKEVA